MLLNLLLSLNLLVCVALIGVVLLQRSEGGALGSGGGPTGLITTRGAGDLLTRTTWILFTLFLLLSLGLTLIGGRMHSSQAFINQLKGTSINPDVLGTARAPTPGQAAPAPAPAPTAPPVQTAPAAATQATPALSAPAPVVRTVARKPAAASPGAPAATAPAAPVIDVPAPTPKPAAAPAPLEVPKPAASKPADPDAPVKTNTPP